MPQSLVLILDNDDYAAVQQLIAYMQRSRDAQGSYLIPEGYSGVAGAAVAEACRGYLDLIGEWKGA